MVVLNFSFLDRKYPFWVNLFKLKFGIEANSIMTNSMVVWTFSILDLKYPFWENLVLKCKLFSLRWNLVHRIFWIWGIWWWHLFLFSTINTLFAKKFPDGQSYYTFLLKFFNLIMFSFSFGIKIKISENVSAVKASF